METTQHAPLLRLAQETRDQIYRYLIAYRKCTLFNPVLVHCRTIEFCKCREGAKLARVCRQLRSECLALFYRTHIFRIVMHSLRKDRVVSWMSTLGDLAIHNIRILQIKGFPTGISSLKPEYMVVIDLDSPLGHNEIAKLKTYRDAKGSEAQVLELEVHFRFAELQRCLRELPEIQGKKVLTKLKLEEILRISGWTHIGT